MYYDNKLSSHKSVSTYLSIIHDNINKSNNSIPRLDKKEIPISNAMNLPISLIGMLTLGCNTRGFGPFNLPFLETGSNFTITSLPKYQKYFKELMVDQHGGLFYKRGTSKHTLHEALFKSTSYEK
jgi:hypothetical protein